MGFIEDIEKLELSDEQKAAAIAAHKSEIDPFKASNRRKDVDAEVDGYSEMGFSDAPAALAFARQVFLSDDGEPGLVLLSDDELNLSDEERTGSAGRQEISVAGALRKFISLIPKTNEGKLKVALSDQALAENNGKRPPDNDEPESEEDKDKQHRESAASWLGRPIERKRSRYRQGGVKVHDDKPEPVGAGKGGES